MTDNLLSQTPTTAVPDEDRRVDPALAARARAMAARGIILLRNDGVLPLAAGRAHRGVRPDTRRTGSPSATAPAAT